MFCFVFVFCDCFCVFCLFVKLVNTSPLLYMILNGSILFRMTDQGQHQLSSTVNANGICSHTVIARSKAAAADSPTPLK